MVQNSFQHIVGVLIAHIIPRFYLSVAKVVATYLRESRGTLFPNNQKRLSFNHFSMQVSSTYSFITPWLKHSNSKIMKSVVTNVLINILSTRALLAESISRFALLLPHNAARKQK